MSPRWNDPDSDLGLRARIALWLRDEVGEDNIFVKADLRQSFPGSEQVDRRMRELRYYDWVIDTNRQDVGLALNQLRLVKIGAPIWEPGAMKRSMSSQISNKQRSTVMSADDFMCTTCGIAGGEEHPDFPGAEPAQLALSSRTLEQADGTTTIEYITECKRCKAGLPTEEAPTLLDVLDGINEIGPAEREELAQWVRRDHRLIRRVEQLWTQYRRLPAESRAAVAERLRTQL